jgi:hypothetical protein
LFNILEGHGLTILVVNARHIKYVPGHKTDKNDSAWIAKLLLAGLLNGSLVPPVEIRDLRDMVRYRRKLEGVVTAGKNRSMRILEDANIKLSSVLSKVNGVSGERIVEALLAGETDTDRLASLCHWRVRAEKEEIMLALMVSAPAERTERIGLVVSAPAERTKWIVLVVSEAPESPEPLSVRGV